MTVTGIWRYPVKSMAGERVRFTPLTTGLVGDRVVQVYDWRGRMVTARTFPRLLQLHATLGVDGEPLVEGLPWHSRAVGRHVEKRLSQVLDSPVLSARSVSTSSRFSFALMVRCRHLAATSDDCVQI